MPNWPLKGTTGAPCMKLRGLNPGGGHSISIETFRGAGEFDGGAGVGTASKPSKYRPPSKNGAAAGAGAAGGPKRSVDSFSGTTRKYPIVGEFDGAGVGVGTMPPAACAAAAAIL